MHRSHRSAVNKPANQPSSPNSGAVPDRRPVPPVPRWVKLFGIAAIVLILVFFISHLTGTAPMGHGM
jgi:hypothetical protein